MPAIDHTALPFDELLETRLRAGDYADRTASRIMQDGWEIGVWIETDWDGPGPVARKILAVNDLLAALKTTLDALYNETHGRKDTAWLKSVKEAAASAIAKAEGES